MVETEITQAQLNKLQYIEVLQKPKTPDQKLAIELEEKRQAKKRYEEARKKAFKKSDKTFLNHLLIYVDNDSITEEMEEREIELTFK
jgi:hypothetical protein